MSAARVSDLVLIPNRPSIVGGRLAPRATRDLSVHWHEVGCGIGIAIRNFDRTLGATAVARPSFRADVTEPKHAEWTEPNNGAQGYGRHHGQRIPPSGSLQRY